MARGTKATTVDLKAPVTCEVTRHGASHLEFRFARGKGRLSPSRSEFREPAELVDYLAGLLGVDPTGGGLRGSASCVGKYDRTAPNGGRAFTFGDPILDLITDAAGTLTMGGQRFDLAAIELESPRYRSGGIRQIDLGMISDEMRDLQLTQAALGQGDFTLIECSDDVVGLASTNPSQRDFYRSGDHLRFKAWKKNYWAYWSIGAEVETWGHDFDTARIESTYIDTFYAQTCFVVKQDSDSDSDDDYLDEYEWGVTAPQPRRVVSMCTARWHGLDFAGQVEAGPTCYTLGDGGILY
jgi:hypothetical protein